MSVLLHIPVLPPPTNALWRYGRGHMYSTPRYKDWQREAKEYITEQANGAIINGPFTVSVTAARPDKRKRDLDGILKPLLDILQSCGVIENDEHCELISARWVTSGDGVAIRVEPAGVE